MVTRTLETNKIKIRTIGKIHAGGVKLILDGRENLEKARKLLYKEAEILKSFLIVVPEKRKPQIIIYNIDDSIGPEDLTEGLAEKKDLRSNF